MDGEKEKQVVGLGRLLCCKETSYTFTRTEPRVREEKETRLAQFPFPSGCPTVANELVVVAFNPRVSFSEEQFLFHFLFQIEHKVSSLTLT